MIGHIEIRMFGAFRAERDGFPITDKMWRRKKAATLAERLALGMDTLVDRETLAMELWPHAEFNSARNNLYSTISRLRSALGPTPDGKSCVLIQNECIGLNGDYVKTDVRLFDQISREVLGNRTGARGPIWSSCALRSSSSTPARCMFPMAVIPLTFCVCGALWNRSISTA